MWESGKLAPSPPPKGKASKKMGEVRQGKGKIKEKRKENKRADKRSKGKRMSGNKGGRNGK